MLEILALIFLTRNIGNLAQQKNIKPGPWKLYVILAWFAGEIIGVLVGFLIFSEVLPAILVGLLCAVTGFFLVKNILSKKPDQMMDDEINQIGQPQP